MDDEGQNGKTGVLKGTGTENIRTPGGIGDGTFLPEKRTNSHVISVRESVLKVQKCDSLVFYTNDCFLYFV